MPFTPITAAPTFRTLEEAAEGEQSTPASFAALPPVLRLRLDGVLCRISPPLAPAAGSSASASNGSGGAESQTKGTLWVTDAALSFIPDSGEGWALDYPTLSLHAVSRSFPEGLAPEASSSTADAEMAHPDGPGCVYCQTDDAAGEEEQDEEDEDAMRELWLLPSSQSELEPLFAALSKAASLHPSFGGQDAAAGHPFAGLGAFGTGAPEGAEAAEGAFDNAEDDDEAPAADGELSAGGRRTLDHLEALLAASSADDVHDEDGMSAEAGPSRHPPASPTASFHSSDPRRLQSSGLEAIDAEASGATNTLHLTALPPLFFEEMELVSGLLDLLHAHGPLASWHPLPAFGRAIVVFEHARDAAKAKTQIDGLRLVFEDDDEAGPMKRQDGDRSPAIRAYFGPQSPLQYEEASRLLGVPVTDRNFLISPPGSPPVGWEPIREDPPNTATLADDLIRALGALRDSGANVATQPAKQQQQQGEGRGSSGLQAPSLIIPPTRTVAPPRHPLAPQHAPLAADGTIAVPGVTVQAYDPDPEELDAGARPAHSISSVKATIESMRGASPSFPAARDDAQPVPTTQLPALALSPALGAGLDGNTGKRITPTGRPPLA